MQNLNYRACAFVLPTPSVTLRYFIGLALVCFSMMSSISHADAGATNVDPTKLSRAFIKEIANDSSLNVEERKDLIETYLTLMPAKAFSQLVETAEIDRFIPKKSFINLNSQATPVDTSSPEEQASARLFKVLSSPAATRQLKHVVAGYFYSQASTFTAARANNRTPAPSTE